MNETVVISYDFQKTLRPGLCSGAIPKTLTWQEERHCIRTNRDKR
jgi:hypothetical protein